MCLLWLSYWLFYWHKNQYPNSIMIKTQLSNNTISDKRQHRNLIGFWFLCQFCEHLFGIFWHYTNRFTMLHIKSTDILNSFCLFNSDARWWLLLLFSDFEWFKLAVESNLKYKTILWHERTVTTILHCFAYYLILKNSVCLCVCLWVCWSGIGSQTMRTTVMKLLQVTQWV